MSAGYPMAQSAGPMPNPAAAGVAVGIGMGAGPGPGYGHAPQAVSAVSMPQAQQQPNGAVGYAPQQMPMQYTTYGGNMAMDQYAMQAQYAPANGGNYASMGPNTMGMKADCPTSMYDMRNSYNYPPMENGANGMGPGPGIGLGPQQMGIQRQYSMPASMGSPMHQQMLPQMMPSAQAQRGNCQPNCSTANVSSASPMTHNPQMQHTVQSPSGNRTPVYMQKGSKNQQPQQSPSHNVPVPANSHNMMNNSVSTVQQQLQYGTGTCSAAVGGSLTHLPLQSIPIQHSQQNGSECTVVSLLISPQHTSLPLPVSTPPTPHLIHSSSVSSAATTPLQHLNPMVKDESANSQQQVAARTSQTLPSPPTADTSFTTVTHYEMPPALQSMKDQFKRYNSRLIQYYESPKRRLPMPYPTGNHVAAPKEPPTFAFVHGMKYYDPQYERRIDQPTSMGPPMGPPPLNRSQSMHASMLSTQFNQPAQNTAPQTTTTSSKPAPKKSRSVSDAEHFHNPMLATNQQGQQMMQSVQQGQAQGHFLPAHMAQQQHPSYQMPPLNRSMSAGFMMPQGPTTGQMLQSQLMQQQNSGGMQSMHQMQGYGTAQNAPMTSQQQQQKGQSQQAQQMMMQSQQQQQQSYSNPGSQQSIGHPQQMEYMCAGCYNPIQQGQSVMHCSGDMCKRIFHKECTRLTPETYRQLELESATCKWVCENCSHMVMR